MGIMNDSGMQGGWQLRRATLDDVAGLHALASLPLVYRYLFDGEAPKHEWIANRLGQSLSDSPSTGLGMWLLERSSARYVGCVELRPYPSPRTAEITYFLDLTIGAGSCPENGMDGKLHTPSVLHRSTRLWQEPINPMQIRGQLCIALACDSIGTSSPRLGLAWNTCLAATIPDRCLVRQGCT